MYSDPVVNEVRKNGEKLSEECGGDVHRMAERLRIATRKSGRRVVLRGEIGKQHARKSDRDSK